MERKTDEEFLEEILDFVINKPEKILKKCPCVVVMDDGHLKPLIERKSVS